MSIGTNVRILVDHNRRIFLREREREPISRKLGLISLWKAFAAKKDFSTANMVRRWSARKGPSSILRMYPACNICLYDEPRV